MPRHTVEKSRAVGNSVTVIRHAMFIIVPDHAIRSHHSDRPSRKRHDAFR
jgi:hypothetical protein